MPGPALPHRFDPGLAEVLRGGRGDDDIALALRLTDDAPLPDWARQITRFGPIATVRVRRDRLAELIDCAAVDTAEIAHPVRSDEVTAPDTAADSPATWPETRRPHGVRGTGAGVVVACLDWGCDVRLPDLRHPGDAAGRPGGTRLLGLWDQRGPSDGNRFGYGCIHDREAIDAALRTADPYAALGYHPGDVDRRRGDGRWTGAHGTHVLSIAAGNGLGGGPAGVAPEADLAFVHLAGTTPVLSGGSLGDSITILEAIDFIYEISGDRPCVINVSVGAHGGPHDGGTNVEQAIDAALSQRPGRAVVNSAGNYRHKRIHAQGRLQPGALLPLRFRVPPADPTTSEIELFYDASDRFAVGVTAPDGTETTLVGPEQDAPVMAGGQAVGHLYHHRRQTAGKGGDRHIDLFLWPGAPEGDWQMTLHGRSVYDGRFHAWIERDSGRAPVFTGPEVSERSTTGTLCNGVHSITVGATDPRSAALRFGRFSSSGPTRDGRAKPEIAAPGVSILAARSTPPDGTKPVPYVIKSGTSMAAPHVAGTVALMFEAAGGPLEISDTRAILFGSARRPDPVGPDTAHLVGHGVLDIAAAEDAARRFADRADAADDATADDVAFPDPPDTEGDAPMPTDTTPDTLSDAVSITPAGLAPRRRQRTRRPAESRGGFAAPSQITDWEALIRFRPSAAILARIGGRKVFRYKLQTIPGAKSDNINLDFYPVYVSRMPTYNGRKMTADTLLRRFRVNINDYLDTGKSEFKPASKLDATLWTSNAPEGAVIFIDIKGPDNAYVVCSEATPRRWRFSTLTQHSPFGTDEHPVSGTREFGYLGGPDRAVFYTQGADRATYRLEWFNRRVFEGGHKLWLSFQREFVNWVNRHNGRAERFIFGTGRPDTRISRRVSWSKVRRQLGL